jgi:acetylornithine deacetylase/succinyl-diaminopimelate desuccinylase-like protein
VCCFEGEEESGAPHLRAYLEMLRDRLRADAWLICDGPVHPSGAPQVVLGVRGCCGFDLTVYGPEQELHSGHYGNWVPNPALELARVATPFLLEIVRGRSGQSPSPAPARGACGRCDRERPLVSPQPGRLPVATRKPEVSTTQSSEAGRNTFQPSRISWS